QGRASAETVMRWRTDRWRGSRSQLRNVVIPVGPDMQTEHVFHRAEIEFAVEMREQLAVARRLPPQRLAQRFRVHLDQDQSGLAKEIVCGGPCNLRGGGEMNKAVARVIGATAINALPLGLAPGRNGTDFVDLSHLSVLNSFGLPKHSGPYRWPPSNSRAGLR